MASPSVKLYRELLKKTKLLPIRSRDYYRTHIRQNYIAHDDEQDKERLAEIVSTARRDAEWVVSKYAPPSEK
jgi:hypothetical protein